MGSVRLRRTWIARQSEASEVGQRFFVALGHGTETAGSRPFDKPLARQATIGIRKRDEFLPKECATRAEQEEIHRMAQIE